MQERIEIVWDSCAGGPNRRERGRGVDVYNCISEIPHKNDIDCSVISVPAAFVRDAAHRRFVELIEEG